ncbi:hypothetical protein M0R45_029483 [Rubus argutus]|uniref:Translin n=1 Tax=Rubus argutus TaxID=59490 RepID=A0AAW1W8A1_RUBAR
MKSAFRNGYFTLSRSLNPNPNPNPTLPSTLFSLSSHPSLINSVRQTATISLRLPDREILAARRVRNTARRIRAVVMEIESTTRLIQASLLLVHQSRSTPEVLEKPKAQIAVLKELYNRLAGIVGESPGLYYRYHAEEKLGLSGLEFALDVEDYLVGICFMSNELPRYVVNQVTAGDYDCPRKVMMFLTDLHAAFRLLNLRNDFLRKKFDGMKYDLRRVEEVYYDVKIRGLAANGDSVERPAAQGQP